jgi:hypothetical protein
MGDFDCLTDDEEDVEEGDEDQEEMASVGVDSMDEERDDSREQEEEGEDSGSTELAGHQRAAGSRLSVVSKGPVTVGGEQEKISRGQRGAEDLKEESAVAVGDGENDGEMWGGEEEEREEVQEENVVGEADGDALGNGWSPVALDLERILAFERQGHLKMPGLIAGDALPRLQKAVDEAFDDSMLAAVVQKIRVLGVDAGDNSFLAAGDELARQGDVLAAKKVLQEWCAKRGCEVPFLQAFNLHDMDSPAGRDIRALATCPRLAQAAASLLGVEGVRLYQTSAFYKSPSHGETSWHTDLHTAPLDTNDMLTCWVALSHIDSDDASPLLFATRSHRDFALAYWYTVEGMTSSSGRKYPIVSHAPLAPGDATFHHGWLIHGAPPNFSGRTRKAFAMTFIADGSRRFRPRGRRQQHDGEELESYAHWLKDVRPGAKIRHPAVPLVWRRAAEEGERGKGAGQGGSKKKAQVFEMSRLEQPVYM